MPYFCFLEKALIRKVGIKGPSSPSRAVVVAWSVFTVVCGFQADEEEERT